MNGIHGGTPQQVSNGAGCVLLVDDEDALRRAYARALEASGCSVVQASTGAQALAALKANDLDVVVTDISMPEMTGIQLLRAVRELDLDLPVILITGNPTVDSAADAVECGALRYLVKPIDHANLVENVQRAVKLGRVARLKREAAEYLGVQEKLVGDRAGLEASLARGLQSLWMAYQPIIGAHTRRVVAYEALVRTREPTIPHPGALFSVAERLHRLTEVGRAIRSHVAATLSSRDTQGDIYINLHAADLLDEHLYAKDAPLAAFARSIVLEITERVALDYSTDVPARIRRLRDIGYRVAIDDLGAGYAGLSYFALLAPDVVKLDMSLVRNVNEETVKQKLVGSFATLCKDLGMTVVAEGIETVAEREAVTALGAELLQGYLFARPGPPFPEAAWP